MAQDPLKNIVALAKRRGFIYPGSEIYGGFANTYSYGPYGAELKRIVKDLWWKRFVNYREDIVGIDGPILLHPKAWHASGHVEGFNDALVDCKECRSRLRADHLLEKALDRDVEGLSMQDLSKLIVDHKVVCPKCGASHWTEVRTFNLMFSTHMSKTDANGDNIAYLRPETAQAIFLDYKNVIDTMRIHVPFGIAQIGKAFRNEITPGNFIFRVIEFEQMEIEYFVREDAWATTFNTWLEEMGSWCQDIGLKGFTHYEHLPEKLSHYSKRTVDFMFEFPFGLGELYGLAYRTNFDLSRHAQFSGQKMEYTDSKTGERFIPHVIEPTFGVDRTILALLCSAYEEELLPDGETRTVLRFKPALAPVKVAIFPLMKKDPLGSTARALYKDLQKHFTCEYDEGGAIGKRYRRQDEIGTPFCITVDFDTLENQTVTLRHRDSMQQERLPISALKETIEKLLQI